MSLRSRSRRLAPGCPSVMHARFCSIPRCAPDGSLLSAPARLLFRQMIDKADDNGFVSLGATIIVSAQRQRAGMSADAAPEITELLRAGWVDVHPEGGWVLREGVDPQGTGGGS